MAANALTRSFAWSLFDQVMKAKESWFPLFKLLTTVKTDLYA